MIIVGQPQLSNASLHALLQASVQIVTVNPFDDPEPIDSDADAVVQSEIAETPTYEE